MAFSENPNTKSIEIKEDGHIVEFDKTGAHKYAWGQMGKIGGGPQKAKYNAPFDIRGIIENAHNKTFKPDINNKHGAMALRG